MTRSHSPSCQRAVSASGPVIEETWRPLGVDTDDEVAEYDALHEGVPIWLATPLWEWIKNTITVRRRDGDGSRNFPMVREALVENMRQKLRIGLPPIRMEENGRTEGEAQFKLVMQQLTKEGQALQRANYLLAHADRVDGEALKAALARSRSAWAVGERVVGRVSFAGCRSGVQRPLTP